MHIAKFASFFIYFVIDGNSNSVNQNQRMGFLHKLKLFGEEKVCLSLRTLIKLAANYTLTCIYTSSFQSVQIVFKNGKI